MKLITCKRGQIQGNQWQIQAHDEMFKVLLLKVGYKIETYKEDSVEYKTLLEFLNLKNQSKAYQPLVKKSFESLLRLRLSKK